MDRHTRIASQVHGFDRVRHGADRELTAGDLDLGAADARRTVLAEGRHGEVLSRGHELTNPVREFRHVRFEFSPGRQLDRENSVLAIDPSRDARGVSAEARDERVAKLVRLHDVVDDEVGREFVQVDVFAVLVLELLAPGCALLFR